MLEIPKERYYNVHVPEIDRHMIRIRSATHTSGVKLPKVHCKDKGVNPNVKPEKQAVYQASKSSQSHVPIEPKVQSQVKPRIGQGQGLSKRIISYNFPNTS